MTYKINLDKFYESLDLVNMEEFYFDNGQGVLYRFNNGCLEQFNRYIFEWVESKLCGFFMERILSGKTKIIKDNHHTSKQLTRLEKWFDENSKNLDRTSKSYRQVISVILEYKPYKRMTKDVYDVVGEKYNVTRGGIMSTIYRIQRKTEWYNFPIGDFIHRLYYVSINEKYWEVNK